MTMKIQSFSQNMLRLATPNGVSLAFPSFLEAAIRLNSGIENTRYIPLPLIVVLSVVKASLYFRFYLSVNNKNSGK